VSSEGLVICGLLYWVIGKIDEDDSPKAVTLFFRIAAVAMQAVGWLSLLVAR